MVSHMLPTLPTQRKRKADGHTSVNSSVHVLLIRAHGGLSNELQMHKRTILSNAWPPRIYTSQLTREAKFSSPPSSVQSMLWPAYHCNLANSIWQSLSRRAVRQTAKPTLLNPIGTYSRTGVRGRLNNIVQRLARASIRCQKHWTCCTKTQSVHEVSRMIVITTPLPVQWNVTTV